MSAEPTLCTRESAEDLPVYEIDLDHCKGCGLCAAECPAGAIDMEAEI